MRTERSEQVGVFQVVLVVLSLYILAALTVEVAVPLQLATQHLLQLTDTAICFVFLFDFFLQLYRAEHRLRFLKWGWIELVSSVPFLPFLRWGRLLRVFRILRAVRSVRTLIDYVFATRARGAFASVLFACAVLVFASAIMILHLETEPESNIKTLGDAFWWAMVTITTVGYGDRFPVTTEGRLLAVLLMTAGVALFGIFTGFVASWFMQPQKPLDELHADIQGLRRELERMRAERSD